MVNGVVFDVEIAYPEAFRQTLCPHQWGESRLQTDGRLAVDRQKLAVPPHGPGPLRNDLAREDFFDDVIIVGRFERPKIKLANVDGFLRVLAAAFATSQMRESGMFIHKAGVLYPPRAANRMRSAHHLPST